MTCIAWKVRLAESEGLAITRYIVVGGDKKGWKQVLGSKAERMHSSARIYKVGALVGAGRAMK